MGIIDWTKGERRDELRRIGEETKVEESGMNKRNVILTNGLGYTWILK